MTETSGNFKITNIKEVKEGEYGVYGDFPVEGASEALDPNLEMTIANPLYNETLNLTPDQRRIMLYGRDNDS